MIGNRLRRAREAAGFSLRELEAAIEGLVTAQAIGKYERDEMTSERPLRRASKKNERWRPPCSTKSNAICS